MIKEFRNFVLRGNVLDLAVGIIIGAAFTAIVNSLVNDIINPFIGIILGGVNLNNLFLVLRPGTVNGEDTWVYNTIAEAQAAGAVTVNFGLFIQAVINFVIVALVLFLILRSFNRMMELTRLRKAQVVVETPPSDPAVVAQENLTTAINRLNETMTRRP